MADKQPASVEDEVKTTGVVAEEKPQEPEAAKAEADLTGKTAAEKPVERTYSAKEYDGVQQAITRLTQENKQLKAKLDEGGLTRAEIVALRELQASNSEVIAALADTVASIAGDEESVKQLRQRQQKAIMQPDINRIDALLSENGLSRDKDFVDWVDKHNFTPKGALEALSVYISKRKGQPNPTIEKKDTSPVATETKPSADDEEPQLTPKQIEKLTAKIRKDYQRERGELEEETGGPTAQRTNDDSIIKRFGEGDNNVTRSQYEKAMKNKGLQP